MENQSPLFNVSDFIAVANQALEYAFQTVEIEGEVSSFKINQGKFVFFDLKDSESSIGCFMMVFALRVPIEDGMKIIVRATPKLTKWGKFSLTVQHIRLSGEGSLKKGFELLKAKLESEGLFSNERKRSLPVMPSRIAVIASTQSAGYEDFIKIISDRWGGIKIDVAHVQVQGEVAADQIIHALTYLNQQEVLPEIIVLIRGGGSADDLAVFNDEKLVRTVAASRAPTITGIGHEIDTSLTDLVSDVRAATPSNAAEIVVPNKHEVNQSVKRSIQSVSSHINYAIDRIYEDQMRIRKSMLQDMYKLLERFESNLSSETSLLSAYDPKRVLNRGYALIRGSVNVGAHIDVETAKEYINVEVKNVKEK